MMNRIPNYFLAALALMMALAACTAGNKQTVPGKEANANAPISPA